MANLNTIRNMEYQTEMPHNQMIINTGEHHTGIIFCPFGTEKPSDISAEECFGHSACSARRSPIGGGGSGWISTPDTGGTSLFKDAPIGDSWILFCLTTLFGAWKMLYRKRNLLLIVLLSIFAGQVYAGITSLDISPAASGGRMTIVPTIPSAPTGKVAVCWGLYYDAACEHEVADIRFHAAPSAGNNAVWLEAPSAAGTYFIKSSIHTGSICGGLLDSYYTYPVQVYPANADIVLEREAQYAATRVDITDAATKHAYGAMRFSKSGVNDESTSVYARYNYFISFPFDVRIGDIYGIGTVGTDWRILYYDGQGRAEEGFFAERTDNWVMFGDTEDVLRAGEGYLLQLNTISMAESNTAIWSDNRDVATLFFPALSTISSITISNETIPALSEAYQCTIDLSATHGAEGDRRVKDSYWRCIGVPGFDSPSGVTGLPYLYAWSTADNSLNVVSSDGYTFAPGHAYLVQHGDAFIWNGIAKPAAIVARPQDTDAYEELMLEIHQDSIWHDRTYVRLASDASEAFEFGKDLIKELNAGRANIYTMIGYERAAANILPDSVTQIPVGVQITQAGEYRLTLSGNAVLTDRTSGARLKEHTVYLDAGTYEGRFVVEIGEAISTSIQYSEVRNQTSSARKVLIDGQVFIEREGRIYTLQGAIY